MMPTCLAPSSVQQNSQFFRLWKAFHKVDYVESMIMESYQARVPTQLHYCEFYSL